MNIDWQSYIGEYLSNSGSNRIDYIKDKMRKDFKEYCSYLSSFDGIRAEVHNYEELNGNRFEIAMIIHMDKIHGGKMRGAPFKVGFNVNDSGNIDLIYTIGYSWADKMNKVLNNKDNDDVAYIYKFEEISESERLEKEWLFQIINQRLIKYADTYK